MVGRHHRQDAGRVLACHQQGGDGDRRRRVARRRLQHDGVWLDACPLDLVLDQEAMVVVADHDRPGEASSGRKRVSVAARKLETWLSKKRMNCLGYMARDSGHRRVPEPPERTTG